MQEMQIDPNTGFLDRYSCLRLTAELVNTAGTSEKPLAVLWIDIDRFKQINESFGYDGGDSIISVIAGRLAEKIKGTSKIGRISADEFIYLAPDVDLENAEKLGLELMQIIEAPVSLGDFHVRLTASIGIADKAR